MIPEPDDSDATAPACRATTARLQLVLDRELAPAALDQDAHAITCVVCRERIRAAMLVLSVIPAPPTIPITFAGSIVDAVRAERRVAFRRRAFAITAGLAVAASLAVAFWPRMPPPVPQPDIAVQPQPARSPEVPPPVPLRIGDEFARAADAFREAARPLTDPAVGAPNLLGALASTLTRAVLQPLAPKLNPARDTLAELPEAARMGFEPVTGTAKKGFNRLLREVNAIQPGGTN